MATSRRLLGVAAALLTVGGLLVFAVAASWPIHITHSQQEPALHQIGTFDQHLVPTGGTVTTSRTDTCIPLRRVLPVGGNHDPAVCHARDDRRLAVARAGLTAGAAGLLAVLGLLVWGGVDDRISRRRALQMQSNPARR